MAVSILRALFTRAQHIAWVAQELVELREKLQRLEIREREHLEKIQLLEAQQERMHARLVGLQGGRPKKASTTSQNGHLALEDIPPGDKAALRRHFGLVPGGRVQENDKGDS